MENNLKTPRWIDALFDRLSPDDLAEEIRGDLYEMFLNDFAEKGLRVARRRYVLNGLGFLAKSFFWRKSSSTNINTSIMFSSYFKMAHRSLMAYKGTSIINIIGLVIGIASALVIFTVIRYELSFNQFHSDIDRIYRMVRVSGDDMSEFRTGISYPVPGAMKAAIPSLESITSMEYLGGAYVDVLDPSGKSVAMFREDVGCVMVQPSFFDIFDYKESTFKWIAGNPEKALIEPFSVVLTETMAHKYFPGGDAVGKSIRFEKFFDSKITGVIQDFPPNTDLPFTILISYSSLEIIHKNGMNDWISVNDPHHTYIKLLPGTTQADMEKQIAKVHAANTSKDIHESRHYLLQKLTEVHQDARFGSYSGRTISKQTILALSIIGIFLLLTASINYVNLTTAQSSMRSKEIGLRKVLGSNRKHVIGQFMTETFIIVLIAGILGLVLSEVLIINFRSLLNLNMSHFNFTDPVVLLSLSVIIFLVSLFSGLYPSLVISRFNPISALKNKFSSESVGNISFRKVLVVAQFAITQMLVVGTFIVVSQMAYFQNVDMGFNREAIITINLPNSSTPREVVLLSNQFQNQSFVSGITFSSTLPSGVRRNRSSMGIGRKDAAGARDYLVFEYQVVDPDYLDVYQIKMVAGRNLQLSDTMGNVLINKTLVKNLQLGSPEESIGRELKIGGEPVLVVGVIEDFYSNSLKESVDNMVMVINPRAYDYCSIKLNIGNETGSWQEAIDQIQTMWTKTYPEHIFSYEFFDENIKAFYEQEQKYARLFQLFSLVFLSIGCLGLYGLITFVVNRKGKEVAIRKVLGATLSNILLMFSKEYMRLIILSFLIAVPVTYYVVDNWLSNFANHIELKWWFFVTPGLCVLIIALFVVTGKSLKAAGANPVDSLKSE